MKLKNGMLLLFLSFTGISLVGCHTVETKVEYVYQTPLVLKPTPTEYPSISIRVNEDLVKYRDMCKVKIDQCNIDKEVLYEQSQKVPEE